MRCWVTNEVAYLLGDRKMGMGPVCLSLFVTFQSAISLIGTPGEAYNSGPMCMYINFGIALAYVLGYFTVVPLMYTLHLTSAFEYLEMRFKSKTVRLLCTIIGMMQTMLYMAIALFSQALALQAAAGLPLWVSVVIVGGIGTLYTSIGGIKSVVWTDALQAVIVFIGMGTVLGKGIVAVGGFSALIEKAGEGGRTNFAILNTDPRERHSMLATIIGGCFLWIVNCFNQSSVQRICSLKTLKAAKIAFIINAPLNLLYGATLTMTGLILYSYVVTIGCDPHQAGLITNKNQMMPYYVFHVLDDLPGFSGLYMSMLFSGALSTLSSGINALSANTVEDLLARPLRNLKDSTVTAIAKLLVIFYGFVVIGLAYLMKSMSGPVTELSATVFGACGGPLSGVYLLAGGFPWANKYGAVVGVLVGLAVNLWVAIGARMYGAPLVSLPPGPTYGCDIINASLSTLSPFNVTAGSPYYNDMSALTIGVQRTTLPTNMTIFASSSSERPFSIYDISYLWFGVIGVVVTFISGAITSCVTGCTDRKKLDSRLIFPFCRKLFRIPEPVRRPEDSSNLYAVKHIRDAWESFKKRSFDIDVLDKDDDDRFSGKVRGQIAQQDNPTCAQQPLISDFSEMHAFSQNNDAHSSKTPT